MSPLGSPENPWPGIPRRLLDAVLAAVAWLRANPKRHVAGAVLKTFEGKEPGFGFCPAGAAALLESPIDVRAMAERPGDWFTADLLREELRLTRMALHMHEFFQLRDPAVPDCREPITFYSAIYQLNDPYGGPRALDAIEMWARSLPVIEPETYGGRDTDPGAPPEGMEHAP